MAKNKMLNIIENIKIKKNLQRKKWYKKKWLQPIGRAPSLCTSVHPLVIMKMPVYIELVHGFRLNNKVLQSAACTFSIMLSLIRCFRLRKEKQNVSLCKERIGVALLVMGNTSM